jgi:hypothetical protein
MSLILMSTKLWNIKIYYILELFFLFQLHLPHPPGNQWKVPREMHQVIYNLAPSHEQAYIYLLVGKACHLLDVRVSTMIIIYHMSVVTWWVRVMVLNDYIFRGTERC